MAKKRVSKRRAAKEGAEPVEEIKEEMVSFKVKGDADVKVSQGMAKPEKYETGQTYETTKDKWLAFYKHATGLDDEPIFEEK